jgi:hypothetical protein
LPETAAFRKALKEAWVSKGEKLTEDVFSGSYAYPPPLLFTRKLE